MQKIKAVDEQKILESAVGFLHERFNAEVSIYTEADQKRFDPKQRSAMAMPYQPAIYIE